MSSAERMSRNSSRLNAIAERAGSLRNQSSQLHSNQVKLRKKAEQHSDILTRTYDAVAAGINRIRGKTPKNKGGKKRTLRKKANKRKTKKSNRK